MADISGVSNGGIYNTPTVNTTNKKDETNTNTDSGLNQATNPNKNSGSGTSTDDGLNKPVNNSGNSSNNTNNTSSGGSTNNSSSNSSSTSNNTTEETNTSPTDNPSHAAKPKSSNDSLDKDAFLKLFLEQLKAQDPTAPMETNQILEQSAMMTQIEMQQQMKENI